ncbi:hypothetical protein BKA63DRAFT_586928, partial [Paraphoma chrysanthemicola]
TTKAVRQPILHSISLLHSHQSHETPTARCQFTPLKSVEEYVASHLAIVPAADGCECPICLDDERQNVVVVTHCSHRYHRKCLLMVSEQRDEHTSYRCPMCRAVFFTQNARLDPPTYHTMTDMEDLVQRRARVQDTIRDLELAIARQNDLHEGVRRGVFDDIADLNVDNTNVLTRELQDLRTYLADLDRIYIADLDVTFEQMRGLAERRRNGASPIDAQSTDASHLLLLLLVALVMALIPTPPQNSR